MIGSTPKIRHTQQGFSMVELLLVVVVAGVLAVVAVPSLTRAKRAAEAGAVIGNLKSLSTIQLNYFSVKGRYARIAELNSFMQNSFGTTSRSSVYRGDYRFRNYPSTNPTDTSLKTNYGFRVTRTENSEIVFEIRYRNFDDGEIIIIEP
jgi:prepilin-type N-terminal cleavage/methylation domain-containing protein